LSNKQKNTIEKKLQWQKELNKKSRSERYIISKNYIEPEYSKKILNEPKFNHKFSSKSLLDLQSDEYLRRKRQKKQELDKIKLEEYKFERNKYNDISIDNNYKLPEYLNKVITEEKTFSKEIFPE